MAALLPEAPIRGNTQLVAPAPTPPTTTRTASAATVRAAAGTIAVRGGRRIAAPEAVGIAAIAAV